MKLFQTKELHEAYAHSLEGGQSLHLHKVIGNRKEAPRCFVEAVARGESIAHLFDMDEDRLKRTAQTLGVRVILVECRGTKRQHIDLCAGPLKKALELAGQVDAAETGVLFTQED